MKVLNLYSGIGGNVKFLDSTYKVTSVECDKEIAIAYQDRYPSHKVVVADAKQFLLDNYKEFDFIWASPPCQTHSRIRKCKVDCRPNKMGIVKPVFPDMSLYQLILFLQNHFKGGYVVENVKPYYKPLISPTVEIDRHLYWSNFHIPVVSFPKTKIIEKVNLSTLKDFDLSSYKNIKNKQQVIRNQVDYSIALHIFQSYKNSLVL